MQAYDDKIKLCKITGRQWGEGKEPIIASPYVQPPAVFAFCDHTAKKLSYRRVTA